MIIHDVKQSSPEWLKLRLGKVTASEADALVSAEGKVRTGVGPQSYLYRKLAEKLLGYQLNDASTFAMNQGVIGELEAIPWFCFDQNMVVDRVGFCTDDANRIGFSPDGLIGEEGGIEVKVPQPANHLQYLLEGVVPKDYVIQIQFSLFVSGRKWWKFLSYSRQWPPLLLHVERDEKIQAALREALDGFLSKFDAAMARIQALKQTNNPQLAHA